MLNDSSPAVDNASFTRRGFGVAAMKPTLLGNASGLAFFKSVNTRPFARSGGSFICSDSTFGCPWSSLYRTVTCPLATSIVMSIGRGNDRPF